MTEEITFKKMYEEISEDIFVLIYKIVCSMNYFSADLKHELKIPYVIKKFPYSELLEMKGLVKDSNDKKECSDSEVATILNRE